MIQVTHWEYSDEESPHHYISEKREYHTWREAEAFLVRERELRKAYGELTTLKELKNRTGTFKKMRLSYSDRGRDYSGWYITTPIRVNN
jgi:hypothetical protein